MSSAGERESAETRQTLTGHPPLGAIFFGLQIIMFFFGFEETKFVYERPLGARQGSIVTVSGRVPVAEPKTSSSGDSKSEKDTHFPPQSESVEAGSYEDLRKLSVININPSLPRKTYWQRLGLWTTSPGPWSHFLRHAWQPFLILWSIPGVLFCSLCYAILLAWSTVMTTALSEYMLLPPYNFTANETE